MRRITALVMGAACGTLVIGAAHGRSEAPQKPAPLGIRLGGFRPGARPSGVGKDWFAAGLDTRIPGRDQGADGQIVSVDYLTQGSSNIFALSYVMMVITPDMPGGFRPYVGLGAGIYRIRINSDLENTTNNTLGVKVVGGLAIKDGLYVQADYHAPATGRVAGVDPKGFAVTIGLRYY